LIQQLYVTVISKGEAVKKKMFRVGLGSYKKEEDYYEYF
jgi:hypothetical protein